MILAFIVVIVLIGVWFFLIQGSVSECPTGINCLGKLILNFQPQINLSNEVLQQYERDRRAWRTHQPEVNSLKMKPFFLIWCVTNQITDICLYLISQENKQNLYYVLSSLFKWFSLILFQKIFLEKSPIDSYKRRI